MSPMDEGAIVGSSGSIDALQRKLKQRHFVDCSLQEVGSGLVKLKVGKTLPGECGEFTDSKLRSEEHTSELQSLMRTSYAVLGLKNKNAPIVHPPSRHKTIQHQAPGTHTAIHNT